MHFKPELNYFSTKTVAAEFFVQPPPPKKIILSRISGLAAEIFD